MKAIYHDRAKQWGEGYGKLQSATKNIEELLGQAAEQVTAEWDRAEDAQGHLVPTLRLSDWTGFASAVFAPDELESPSHMRNRLNRLWGDLLQIRSSKQLRDLMSTDEENHRDA